MKSTAILAMLISLVTGIGTAPTTTRRRVSIPPTVSHRVFATDQLEAYMTDAGIAYIRPGLKLVVNGLTIGNDRRPVVDLTLTDGLDQPLDRLGKVTPGAIALSFVLACTTRSRRTTRRTSPASRRPAPTARIPARRPSRRRPIPAERSPTWRPAT